MLVSLNPENALARGAEKIVFRHPENDKQLIKVLNPETPARKPSRGWALFARFNRFPQFDCYVKEVVEHISLREEGGASDQYVQDIVGFVDTNLGLGIVVTAVCKSNGELADTLFNVIRKQQFGRQHLAALEDLLSWIDQSGLVVRDLTTRNIVWDEVNGRLVLIDGIGGQRLLSLRYFSAFYNRISNKKRTEKLRRRILNQIRINGVSSSEFSDRSFEEHLA